VYLQLKLILEGIKDIVLGPIALVALVIDLLFRKSSPRRLFYEVMRGGERFERFLDLYSALPERIAERERQGSEKNMDTLLRWGEGQLQTLTGKPTDSRDSRRDASRDG
jgi:hypothetical protein